jgi:hypothetical protein
MRTTVYIDGFNLYYGSLKGSGHKWLDLFAFFQRTLPTNNNLLKVKYFTARVKPLSHDIDAPIRQDVYLRALKFLYPQQIEIIEGNFQIKKKKAPLASNPSQIVQVIQAEEKGSDVNLAVELVNDGWLNTFECAVVVSNDADLERALRIVKQQHKKKVFLFTPGAPKRTPLAVLTRWSHKQFQLLPTNLALCQLPTTIANGITNPISW